jgi:Na+/H+ antiporter NhaA
MPVYLKIVRALAFVVLAVIVFSTLSPASLRPGTGHVIFERWASFALFGTFLGLSFPRAIGRGAIFVLFLVVGLELLQELVPGRHGEIEDALIKSAGALAGLGSAAVGDFIRKSTRQ